MITRRELLIGLGAALGATRSTGFEAPPSTPLATGDNTAAKVAYVNAHVWTGSNSPATALGTIGNRIAAVGDAATVRAALGASARVVDLEGAFAMPGFIDNHTHFLRASLMLGTPELRTAQTREQFVSRIAESARAMRPGKWLQGGNWDEQMWGGELPTRDWIDAVTPRTPVAVTRLDLHLVLLNSLALKLAGIDRNTPAPEGGLILRDADGEPNGLLKDTAISLVERVIPAPSDADVELALQAGMKHALSKGVTQAHLTELDWVTHHALRRMRSRDALDIRFYSLVPIEEWRTLAELVRAEGRGDDWMRWGGVKGLIDGSLGSRTALFKEPYADDPHNRGIYRTPPEKLREYIMQADAAGLHVAVHAIGDAGIGEVLDMFAAAVARNGERDRRFRIEHAQHVDAGDVARFARQKVIASMQPYHAIDDGRWAEKPLGKQRLTGAWAMRSLLDAQACVTLGSDWPVAPIDPLLGIEAAVLRRTIDGSHSEGWVPQQRITVAEALTAYTAANAYAGFQEDRLGKIAPGRLADVVVLDTDITRCPPDRISRAKVVRTLVDGQSAHS